MGKEKKILASLAIGVMIAVTACNKTDDTSTSMSDQDFMKTATYINLAAVDEGTLSASKGNDTAVRAYAGIIVSDHNAMQTELQSLAQQKNLTLPKATDEEHTTQEIILNNKAAQILLSNNATGRAYDSVYVHYEMANQQNAFNLFENEANHGTNADVRSYAAKYLPRLRFHVQQIDTIAAHQHF